MEKQNNEDFFIQLLNTWLYFTNNKFPVPTSIEKKYIIGFSSDNPYFYCITPKNISDKFSIISDLGRFFQPGPISSMNFEEKLNLPIVHHK